MARFYLSPEQWDDDRPMLQGDEARHAVKVLRMKEGDACTVFDGRGHASLARIRTIVSQTEIGLYLEEPLPQAPPLPDLTLCQSIPKGANMDLIIQKAVELGVGRIIPLITEHTVVRIDGRDREAKRAKWQRTALEACKQCGQNVMPVVEAPRAYGDWIRKYRAEGVCIIASLADGALPVRTVLEEARRDGCGQASVLIGPEGDFSAHETELALAAGFRPVTLGHIVLRVETAAFFCLSALRYSLDPLHV